MSDCEPNCDINNNCSLINGKTDKYCISKTTLKSQSKSNDSSNVEGLDLVDVSAHTSKSTRKTPTKSQKSQAIKVIGRFLKKTRKTRRKTPTKSQKSQARKVIGRFLKKTRKTIRKTPTKSQKSQAIKVIGRFLEKKKDKIRKHFLTTICSDSGVCMALGKELDIIRKFFNGFTDFNYVVDTKGIGSVSANGFVMKLTYQKDDYKSYAILKSSQERMDPDNPDNVPANQPDNLVYEYAVGQFINKQCKIFPCFLETYGLYYYKSDEFWNRFNVNRNHASKSILKDSLKHETEIEIDYAKACSHHKHAAILIQDIDNPISLKELLEENFNENFMNFNLLYILIQVYYPLAMLANEFTHYDLHLSNVLIYKLPENQHIEYEFTDSDNNTFSFNTKYIVKIIDYGRSFFRDSDTNNSLTIYTKLCEISDCSKQHKSYYRDKKCGSAYGFTWLLNTTIANLEGTYYIDSTKRNMSHDLLLVDIIIHSRYEYDQKPRLYTKVKSEYYNKMSTEIKALFDNVIYGEPVLFKIDNRVYNIKGTKEMVDSPRNYIVNVISLYKELFKQINTQSFIDFNTGDFIDSTNIGKLQMDGKTPMKFLPPN